MPFDTSKLEALKQRMIEVGKLQGVAGIPDAATYPNGVKVAQNAEWQEFGTSRIPPRSFRRAAIDKRGNEWKQLLERNIKLCLAGTLQPQQVFLQVALMCAGDMQREIKALTQPPLKPATIKRKGFDKPLIDTGTMWQAITGIVQQKGS